MISIRQRSLLARIEGQLASLARLTSLARSAGTSGGQQPEAAALHWQRIEWAGRALHPLLAAQDERARFKRLFAELKALRGVAIGSSGFLHRATLLRADCVIWQLSLAQERWQGRQQGRQLNRFSRHVNRASEPHVNEPRANEKGQ